MTGSTLHSPAHGTALRPLKLCREKFRFESALGRGRAHRDITIGVNSTNALNPACIQSASYLPTAVGKLRTAIERTNSLVALAVRPFIQQWNRWILQFGTGPVSTAGKCFSFLRALHQDPAKSLGVAGILFTPFYQHRLPKSAG